MLRYGFFAIFLALSFNFDLPENCFSEEYKSKVIPEHLITQSLHDLNDSYGDVPSGVHCDSDTYLAAKLICKNKYLHQLELLSSRAQAYKIEDATKSVIEHQTFQAELPKLCRTKRCIYEFFKKSIDASLAGLSPFAN